jgi:hypothetical protein
MGQNRHSRGRGDYATGSDLARWVGMKQQGFSFRHTLLMWGSLVLVAGLLAAA